MIIRDKDNVKIDIINCKNQSNATNRIGEFVRLTHIPSGITVTKFDEKIQCFALQKATIEINKLIKTWKETKWTNLEYGVKIKKNGKQIRF